MSPRRPVYCFNEDKAYHSGMQASLAHKWPDTSIHTTLGKAAQRGRALAKRRDGSFWCYLDRKAEAQKELEMYLRMHPGFQLVKEFVGAKELGRKKWSDKLDDTRFLKSEWSVLFVSSDPDERHPVKIMNRQGAVTYCRMEQLV